jgi:Fic family protein
VQSFVDLHGLIGRVPTAVVGNLSAADQGLGSDQLYRAQLPGLLDTLADRARVLSVTASSAIEGVTAATPERAERIVRGDVQSLRNRDEREIAGYRDALDYVYREDFSPVNVGLVLHLHRLLFRHTEVSGGQLKTQDNVVVGRAADGTTTPRFTPVPGARTEYFLAELASRYTSSIAVGEHHPVLLVGLFVLDLLVIHPFEDGNGRVSRVLSNALLLDRGHQVCRNVSLEQLISDRDDDYYRTLLFSTHGWHGGNHDPWPWLEYFTGILAAAYEIFSKWAAAARVGVSKQDRVRDHVLRHAPARFRLDDLRTALPGVSDQTIRLVLNSLRADGLVRNEGTGRAASWARVEAAEPANEPYKPANLKID